MRILLVLPVLLIALEATAQAGWFGRGRRAPSVSYAPRVATPQVQYQQAASHSGPGHQVVTASATAQAVPAAGPGQVVEDALDEVNAERARRGLRPFARDPSLTQAALACARQRAARRIAGHLPNDFAYLPAGTSATAAGCGALEPSWGWGTCCTYENHTYAGAAWVMGADGKRYMHLFVR